MIRLMLKNLGQYGAAAPVLILTALVFLFATSRSVLAATNRLTWQGQDWLVEGVNMPWFNWSCDFGCNSSGGVVQTKNTIATEFAKLKTSGAHVVRWWVFPANPWQITRDSSGPTGLNPAIYADFDAALVLAEQYDLYYNFVLFSSPLGPPAAWTNDPVQRTKLAQVLGPLFARYSNNPRVMTWEIYNEPEFEIWNNQIGQAETVATAKAITDSIHANSNALVTIGNAFADGMPMWQSVNLDYYSPHWYDYMSGGTYCLRCHDYAYYQTSMGINKPIVIGEIYTGPDSDALPRHNDFYNKGYAGTWSWSLFWDHTSDNMKVDLTAMQNFTNGKSFIGPKTITPTPSSNQSIPGDINNSGKVDIFDYNLLLTDYGATTGTGLRSDINNSGKVDIFDYNILLTNFGKTTP